MHEIGADQSAFQIVKSGCCQTILLKRLATKVAGLCVRVSANFLG
jgi:hypothetical protein